jgi:hypothetical protein
VVKPGVQIGLGIGAMAVKNDLRPPNASVCAGTPHATSLVIVSSSIRAYIAKSEYFM